MAFAKLLADPCQAALTHPVYSGGEGGYLVRTDQWYTFGTSGTDTAGYFHWVPGFMASDNHELMVAAAAGGGTGAAATAFAGVPGKTFITNTASAFRCVAACVRVTFPGAEAARQGRVHFGQTNGGVINNGVTYTPDSIATLLPHYTRTPAAEVELRWKPNDGDQLFVDPAIATQPEDRRRRGALTVAWAGLPAAVGLIFHMTAVYEWQPLAANGLAVPNASRSLSRSTLDQVLNYMQNAGESFVSGVFEAGHGALASYLGGAYGLMGAPMRRRGMTALTY
jgi:hypothetical protein